MKKIIALILVLTINTISVNIQTEEEFNPVLNEGYDIKEIKMIEYQLFTPSEDINAKTLERFLAGEISSARLPMEGSFVVGLNGEHLLTNIELRFAEGTAPQSIELVSTDYTHAKKYEILLDTEVNQDDVIEISLNKIRCAYLGVEIKGAPADCEIIGLQIDGEPGYPVCLENEKIVLAKDDPQNPLTVWNLPLHQGVYDLANELLGEDAPSLTNHQKVMRFMEYIRTYRVGLNVSEISQPMRDRIGACGTYANILVALASTQNMECKIITMANYPVNNGHVVALISTDGVRWSVYDPTYCAYYTTTPENEIDPYVLSLDELRLGHGKDEDVTCVALATERLTSEQAYAFLGPEIYEQANPIGAIGPENPLFYPLYLDFNEDREILRNEFGTTYQGASYIGAAGMNNSHIWKLDGLNAGDV